jgi:hypothetical protein
MYRSWLIEHRGYDLDDYELADVLRDLHVGERLGLETAELTELLNASMQPEHEEALRSLRKKVGFDDRMVPGAAAPTSQQAE